MDRCFCQTDSDLCHGRTTSTPIPMTQPIRKKYVEIFRSFLMSKICCCLFFSWSSPLHVPVATPAGINNRPMKQGELILGLYDVNQQRLIDNGGSVLIGDRLFIEIKYRTGLIAKIHSRSYSSLFVFSRGLQFRSSSNHCGKLFNSLECFRQ